MSADRQGDMTEAKRIAELLCGRIERGKRKRQQRRYFKKGSVEEKAARRALAKELRAIKKPLEFGLRLAIADLIDSDSNTDRRIVFENRGAGAKSDAEAESNVAEFFRLELDRLKKTEAAIEAAMEEFGLEKSRVKDIWREWKPILDRRHRIHGPLSKETVGKYWPQD